MEIMARSRKTSIPSSIFCKMAMSRCMVIGRSGFRHQKPYQQRYDSL